MTTEISALIRLAEGSIRSRLQAGVRLNVMLGATECFAEVPEESIGEALMILLVNASQLTSKGAITFGYEIFDDELNFFVKDTGQGLNAEQKARLEDLFDADDTTSPGLGDSMIRAYSLVKQLGGNMGVESRGLGRGCTFWFTIPCSPTTQMETPTTEHTEQSDEVSSVQSTSRRTTILVAEDNDSNYLLFQTVLKKKYDVIRATDGMEAVEMFKQYNPDLIIMDIQMPKMDGYEAVREIRKISSSVPIIAATAYAFVTDRQRLLQDGFNGYVSKPINLTRLDMEINSCLNGK